MPKAPPDSGKETDMKKVPPVLGVFLGLSLVLAFAAMVHAPGKAGAAEMECGALLEKLAKTGELPGMAINPKDETVKIVLSQGTCKESIEAWSRRPPLKAEKPGKGAAQPAPSPKGKSGTASPAPAETPKPAAPPAPCDYRLNELWAPQVIKIEGIDHWLARVFTVDLDRNRQVDNVKFSFRAKDNSERVISYFAPSPESPGHTYPALKLPDESLIGRLCFGDLRFEKPEFFGEEKVRKKWIDVQKPDLAAEMDARKKGVPYKPPERAKKTPPPRPEEETPWEILLAIAVGLAVLGGGALMVAKKLRPDQEDEDGEEDEEDEE